MSECYDIDFAKSLSERVLDYLRQAPEGTATAYDIAKAVNPTDDGGCELAPVSKAIHSHMRSRNSPAIRRQGIARRSDGRSEYLFVLTEEGWRRAGQPDGRQGGPMPGDAEEKPGVQSTVPAGGKAEPASSSAGRVDLEALRAYLNQIEERERQVEVVEDRLARFMGGLSAELPWLMQRIQKYADSRSE